ncbi:MAG: hypothetical protein CML20_16400 [Rheinheimera sp.]|uniref:hypothetical protein n=1 Tax=Arsukibacterium sp. UBA3155 TaxID=1946058 RepID=UPI000C8CFD5D|nr:hypothetical protein [Arsukibacterium sp. UBA3155]MAD76341.1 hypothetical protein [Rheinheimera sp.]|tara:strand:+ start:103172 stop:103717 length:546 start_codon:yes stop_codon:yes gene_type:complete
MNLIKSIGLLSLLVCAAACQAKSQNYMDCEWSIPAGFNQKAEFEYSNSVDEDDLENWTPASIMFTHDSGTDVNHYLQLNSDADSEVLLVAHTAQPGDRFKYLSSYIRKESFGTPFIVAQLRIIKDDKMLALLGLSKADALAMTSGCAEFSQVEQHYNVLQQIEHGFSEFLKSEHGMQVLVP